MLDMFVFLYQQSSYVIGYLFVYSDLFEKCIDIFIK
jgi:hypothetical protein